MLVVLFLGLIISSTVAVPLVPFMSENDNPNEFSDYGKNILCYFVITRFKNVFSFFLRKTMVFKRSSIHAFYQDGWK